MEDAGSGRAKNRTSIALARHNTCGENASTRVNTGAWTLLIWRRCAGERIQRYPSPRASEGRQITGAARGGSSRQHRANLEHTAICRASALYRLRMDSAYSDHRWRGNDAPPPGVGKTQRPQRGAAPLCSVEGYGAEGQPQLISLVNSWRNGISG